MCGPTDHRPLSGPGAAGRGHGWAVLHQNSTKQMRPPLTHGPVGSPRRAPGHYSRIGPVRDEHACNACVRPRPRAAVGPRRGRQRAQWGRAAPKLNQANASSSHTRPRGVPTEGSWPLSQNGVPTLFSLVKCFFSEIILSHSEWYNPLTAGAACVALSLEWVRRPSHGASLLPAPAPT